MLLLKCLLLVALLNTANAACIKTSWNYHRAGQSMCSAVGLYIRGLERVGYQGEEDYIDNLNEVQCCSAPAQWSNIEIQVVYADWTHELDRTNVWAFCPPGYFLQGLHTSDGGYLGNIEGARCTKPSSHPFYYGDCYNENIESCFNAEGLCSCRENYSVVGLYKSFCDGLSCLDTLRCCQMAEAPEVIDEVEEVKTRIMDTTLWNMANLANMLGYGWCGGCNGPYVGEDFNREGYEWKANKNVLHGGNCDGYMSHHRLSLTFTNWDYVVKRITYGQSVVDLLEKESVDYGIIYNKHSTPVTEDFQFTETVEATLTHSTTSSWRNIHELGISLNFNIPNTGFGTSISYTTAFEQSYTTLNDTNNKKGKVFTKHSSKTLAAFSAARYDVSVTKVRTTIPYTATIIAKFSTEFKGFLRWGEGYSSPITNYHYLHRGSEGRPTFNYRFGDESVPFYTALRRESENQSSPWLWKEMMKNYPRASHVINRLTDESLYEFTLTGKLEHVYGKQIEVVWETVNYTRRNERPASSHDRKIISGYLVAKSGPNDRSAKVEYPKVSLVSSEPFKLEELTPVYNSA